MRMDNWGKVLSTKSKRIDKRTKLAKALEAQGEIPIDKKTRIVYNDRKREENSV